MNVGVGIPVLIVETVYPAPSEDEGDYCPDGEAFANDSWLTFRELVRLIRDGGYSHPSSFPICTPSPHDWLLGSDDVDMRTGELTVPSLHLAPNATARHAKYWAKAWRAAGVVFNREDRK